VSLEERVLRHRCVEAWAMTVPWTGFPMSELVRLAAPKPEAKFVVFETAAQRDTMPGLRQSWYPWPYSDGCTIAEARNELAFMATGMYGKPLPPQNGAPLRVLFPWKYGFKASKSVVRVTFQAEQPVGYWEKLQASEYGFWANVNPEVAHPRWSQASERLLGSNERVPTRIFNGYGEFVAPLYAGMENQRIYY
jgi:sulfoxide reductase catalytic subunit YedY